MKKAKPTKRLFSFEFEFESHSEGSTHRKPEAHDLTISFRTAIRFEKKSI